MDIEYSFESESMPFLHSYKLHLSTFPDFFSESFFDQLIKVFETENIDSNQIDSILIYDEVNAAWKVIDNKIPPKELITPQLKLKIVLKDFRLEQEKLMMKQIFEMQEEVKALKDTIQDLLNHRNNAIQDCLLNTSRSVSIDNTLLQPELGKSVSMNGTTGQSPYRKRESDAIFLYAVPLVKESIKTVTALSNPVDSYKEVANIIEEVKSDNKEISVKINIGTFDKLRNAISMRPKILHLACQGNYEMEDDTLKVYLYLERNELNGVADKYDIDTFKQWFTAEIKNGNEVRPRLLIMSGWCSKELGEAIRQAGVPNVVTIDNDTQTIDAATQRFLKIFYHYLVLGRSIREAFEQAKDDLKVSHGKFKLCCCSHKHKKNCGLLEELITNREEAHAKHIPECKCNFGGNIHLKSCRWVSIINELSYEIKPMKDNPRKVRVCCCNPELPHDEEEKFVLISQSFEAQEERLFVNLADSEPLISYPFDPQVLPIIDQQLLGRNVKLYQLLTIFTSENSENQIVSISGSKGIGKGLLVKTVAKYAIERGLFPEGSVLISLSSVAWLLSNLNTALLPPPYKEARSLSELGVKIKGIQKLVVIQCYAIMEKDFLQIIKALRTVLSEGTKTKFIILAKRKVSMEYATDIVFESDLDPLSAFLIIKRKNPEWPYAYNYFESTDLASALITPWLAKKAALMLKTDSADEVYLKLSKEGLINNSEKDTSFTQENYIKSEKDVFKNLRANCEDMTPIYVLAQLPFGVLESDLQYICRDDLAKWKDKAKDFISDSSNDTQVLIKCSKHEELGENVYKLVDVSANYVNEYLLAAGDRARYLMFCLEALGSMIHRIVCSYKADVYKQVKYNEFSAMLGEGIWGFGDSPYDAKKLHSDLVVWFQVCKDNFRLFLDSKILELTITDISNIDINKVMKNIKELSICMFTMLLHLGRPQEAIEIANSVQTFAATQVKLSQSVRHKKIKRYCYDLIGIMQLMKGGLFFKDPDVIEMKKAVRQAEESETAFKVSENEIGLGEALFLQGLLSALDQDKKKYASAIFQEAKSKFNQKTYPIGIVRVNIAEAKLLITSTIQSDGDGYIDELLKNSLKILSEKLHYEDMEAECYYIKAKCAERNKDYSLLRENLMTALEKCRCAGNKIMEVDCMKMFNESSSCMQQDYPRLVFLKCNPIVKQETDGTIHALEPLTRIQYFFTTIVLGYFENENVTVKVHFDILTRESLKQAMIKGCLVLQIIPSYWTDDSMSFEGPLGELDQASLSDLEMMLSNCVKTSQCKLVVITSPSSQSIAKVFCKLGISHVICFCFTPNDFDVYKDFVSPANVYETYLFDFTTELHRLLIRKETIRNACESAAKLADENVKLKMKQAGIKNFTMNFAEKFVILPLDKDNSLHNEVIFPNLRPGKYIATSPERGICDIEFERTVLVGRQLECFRLASEIVNNRCVNLYGHSGVGKTKLAKEVAYFLYAKAYFLSGIYYRDDIQEIYNLKCTISLENSKNGNSSILLIIDNMDASTWQKTMYFFQSLRDEYKYSFLFISQKPLEHTPGFNIVKQRLNPFNEEESIEYVLSTVEKLRTKADYFNTNCIMNRRKLKEQVLNSLAFRQAHGYLELLNILCKKLAKGTDVAKIDLLKEPKTSEYFKQMITNYEMNRKNMYAFNKLKATHNSPYRHKKNREKVSQNRKLEPSSIKITAINSLNKSSFYKEDQIQSDISTLKVNKLLAEESRVLESEDWTDDDFDFISDTEQNKANCTADKETTKAEILQHEELETSNIEDNKNMNVTGKQGGSDKEEDYEESSNSEEFDNANKANHRIKKKVKSSRRTLKSISKPKGKLRSKRRI